MEFCSFDGGVDSEHNGVGFMEISTSFEMQGPLFLEHYHSHHVEGGGRSYNQHLSSKDPCSYDFKVICQILSQWTMLKAFCSRPGLGNRGGKDGYLMTPWHCHWPLMVA